MSRKKSREVRALRRFLGMRIHRTPHFAQELQGWRLRRNIQAACERWGRRQ